MEETFLNHGKVSSPIQKESPTRRYFKEIGKPLEVIPNLEDFLSFVRRLFVWDFLCLKETLADRS
jgi:hypothetical protein